MTRPIPQTRFPARLLSQSLLTYASTTLLLTVLATPFFTVVAEPEGAEESSPLVTQATITDVSASDVTDRESRLRTMEDELLKQLSVSETSPQQDTKKPSLADIKHVSDKVEAPKRFDAKPSAPSPSSNPKPSVIKEDTAESKPPVPVVEYEEIPDSAPRVPQSASVVSVSAVPAAPVHTRSTTRPHRKSTTTVSTMTENLSAKDLEHRLAITETQLNLLTQELESTKRKLTTSEARVRELNDQLENRGESSAADTATSIEARAAAVTISEPDIRPSIDTEVARITKNKAPLRIGPGSRESIITHLSRDNLVTIEHRTGGWYRIVTSDGARGWIPGDYLIFDTEMYSDSTVHVGAYDPRIEPTGGRY